MITRRDLIIGGLCAGSMGLATAAVPRKVMASYRSVKLEDAIPKRIGPWQHVESSSNILPQDENSLSAQLYSQMVSRVYAASGHETVMMVIAYGDSQSDTLQLHRPEVCYEASGFKITDSEPVAFKSGAFGEITGRYLMAEAAYRKEAILYWTRIGNSLPTNRLDQQLSKLREGLNGVVPDGTLVRLSVLVDADQPMPETLPEFANALLSSVAEQARQMLIGTMRG